MPYAYIEEVDGKHELKISRGSEPMPNLKQRIQAEVEKIKPLYYTETDPGHYTAVLNNHESPDARQITDNIMDILLDEVG